MVICIHTIPHAPSLAQSLVIFMPGLSPQTDTQTYNPSGAVRPRYYFEGSALNGKCQTKTEIKGGGKQREGEGRRHERGGEKKRRWQCLREQTSPPVWLPDSKEQTGGEGRRTSGAVCPCGCLCAWAQRCGIFPTERRASVRLGSTWTIACGSCPCLSDCRAIRRYTWPGVLP